ncbi:nicotinate-nucleotide adenylyltransferase [Thermomonas paludicola]|uniref:nicotinate-nucleotide adenylyltransferase n=1 Tax=Thermomonas paludicola TaxID=2884874 RepID=UPI002114DE84|nr:nicotinate-nucleotide adenylyltransferase [Thermomonas paludicola]
MNPRLRVFYGGSFDPVHNGHLAIARAARDALAADVALLPARDPPHKPGTAASAEQRAQMLALAIDGETGLRVDRRELGRSGPSYTVDTLAELRAELGADAPIAWLIGSDSLRQLATWHRWRELFELGHLVAVQRPGAEVDVVRLREAAPAVLAEINDRWLPPGALVESPLGGFALLPLAHLQPESSTELRWRIQNKEPWQEWVPPKVAAYIGRLNLYAGAAVILRTSHQSDCP